MFLLCLPLWGVPFLSACPQSTGSENGDEGGHGGAPGGEDSGTLMPPDAGAPDSGMNLPPDGEDSGTLMPPDAGTSMTDGGSPDGLDGGGHSPPDASVPAMDSGLIDMDGGDSDDSGSIMADGGGEHMPADAGGAGNDGGAILNDGGPLSDSGTDDLGLELFAGTTTSCSDPFLVEISATQPLVTVHTPANLLSPLSSFPTGVLGCHPPPPGAADFHYSVRVQEETFLLLRVENESPESHFQFQIIGIANCSDPQAMGKPTPFYCGPHNPPENATARMVLGEGTYPISVVQWLQGFPSQPMNEMWNFIFQIRRLEFVSLEIVPDTLVVQSGEQFQMSALANLTQQETANLTAAVNWTSSDPSVATMDNDQEKGLLTAVAPGETTITITYPAQNAETSTLIIVQ